MKIEQHLCTLEQAKKLKELGISQDSLFSFFGSEEMRLRDNGKDAQYSDWIFIQNTIPVNNQQLDWRDNVDCRKSIASAFTVAELGVMLPQTIQFQKTQKASIKITRMNAWTIYYNRHSSGSNVMMVEKKNEAEVRAEALIYLLENNLVTAESCNQRLTA